MTVQTLAIIVLLVSFFVMIFLRFPIAYAVGLSSVLCMLVQGQALTDVCRLMVKGISSFSLMAVPFFITMGVLMGSGGISEKLIALADACVGWMRGGPTCSWSLWKAWALRLSAAWADVRARRPTSTAWHARAFSSRVVMPTHSAPTAAPFAR